MKTHLVMAKTFARLLDRQFSFLGFRFGLDPILGLFPGFGDIITLAFSFYIVWIGVEMRLPDKVIALMIRNIFFDFAIGLVPVVGDLADFAFKANSKNLALIEKYAPITVLAD